eukprot:TRINITY_DN26853_c0_g1_i1.p1 TRINITY_DN26853_c0_g1~~TRINITY_DN26853_c0_g1_i1.p1  ORF type:complete len:534 (+),score=148.61 TRINITY_DN26853_c0_g1_i1:111-1604(+)
MLSVLSSGTLHLSEELKKERVDTERMRAENARLRHDMRLWRDQVRRHLESVWSHFAAGDLRTLLRLAFLSFQSSRGYAQVSRRPRHTGMRPPLPSRRSDCWSWLWRRKILALWRRAAVSSARFALRSRAEAAENEVHEATDLHGERSRADAALIAELEDALRLERARAAEREAELQAARGQVSELQATLKESYLMQFEEAQERQRLEASVEALRQELGGALDQRRQLAAELARQRDLLQRSEERHNEREARLYEASGELSLAEEVIDDIASSKCIGLRRFFERYNMPSVLLSLFGKTLELQAQVRSHRGLHGALTHGSASHASLSSVGAASCTVASLPPPSLLGGCGSSPRLATISSLLEGEVRQQVCLNGSVSRHSLQTYVESLRLQNVTSSMVVQVVFALLGLSASDTAFEAARFTSTLLSPPPWQQLDFATVLWGAAGEPAAAVVQQHRRARSHGGAAAAAWPTARGGGGACVARTNRSRSPGTPVKQQQRGWV